MANRCLTRGAFQRCDQFSRNLGSPAFVSGKRAAERAQMGSQPVQPCGPLLWHPAHIDLWSTSLERKEHLVLAASPAMRVCSLLLMQQQQYLWIIDAACSATHK
eukprot:TRINITY_DN999_c0_g3_i1.p2 TRINITY_DN999_c0_g3~~TRINITY_DN999_c0_g3_i1.p2  ORF type:complete len:104 (-),score=3.37 TRINITY_DN999_c0_g3_i1:196-507(-)